MKASDELRQEIHEQLCTFTNCKAHEAVVDRIMAILDRRAAPSPTEPSDGEQLRKLQALIPLMLDAIPWGAYKGALMEDAAIRAAMRREGGT